MASANQVSGFLQASYSLGATVSPLIATTMFTKGGLPWYSFYYIMVSCEKNIGNFLINLIGWWFRPGIGCVDLGVLGTIGSGLSTGES